MNNPIVIEEEDHGDTFNDPIIIEEDNQSRSNLPEDNGCRFHFAEDFFNYQI